MEANGEALLDPAHDGDDLYEREEPKEETLPIVVFRLGREWYGVEITKVREVMKVGKLTYLPCGPEHIAGIVNLRGNILSVTDLKTLLGLPQEESTDKRKIIAMESGGMETGFLVDEVVESIEVPVSKMELPLLTLPPEEGKYIKGHCSVQGKLIALISVEKVFEKRT